jgi:hypothetical protein
MYDTRWPRPGPAMAAVAAVLGLVAGVVLGLSSPGSAPRARAAPPVATTAAAPTTTTTLPEEFFTVVLGSFDRRVGADERLRLVRRQGVRDARLLERGRYDLGTRWAVYSGVFTTESEAEAHEEELAQLGVAEHFVKPVKLAG